MLFPILYVQGCRIKIVKLFMKSSYLVIKNELGCFPKNHFSHWALLSWNTPHFEKKIYL